MPSKLPAVLGYSHHTGEPPWLPPIGECRGARDAPHRVFSGYAKQVDLRLDPATADDSAARFVGALRDRMAGVFAGSADSSGLVRGSRCPVSEVRDALRHPLDTDFGNKRAPASI